MRFKIFFQLKKNIISSIENDIVQEIAIGINETHGMNEFPNKLQNEINKMDRRMLNGEETDNNNTAQSTGNILRKLLNISENTNRFVKSLEIFEQFKEYIQKNMNKLNFSYKQSHLIIDEAFIDEPELYEEMKNKSEDLYNMSLNYYQKITESYNSLIYYIDKSLIDINDLLNQCANITYETFQKEFEKLSNKYPDFSIEKNENENRDPIKSISNTTNTQYTTEANFEYIEKNVKFIYSLSSEGEGQIKNYKIFASVINQIKPKKLTFEIANKFGDECGKDYQTVEVEFGGINYTTTLIYDTESNLVNLTSLSDFDSFNYHEARYRINPSNEYINIGSLGVEMCFNDPSQCGEPETITARNQKKR